MSDSDFEQQFADCSLDPETFTHTSHVRLAWIHLRKYGIHQAIENLNTQIAQYDAVHGDGTKFHKTLTMAAIYVVHHFVNKSRSANFDDFNREFPRLNAGFRQLVAQHYSHDRLALPKAKTDFVEPDLLPFQISDS
jgi:hypothetical protein